jgi:hypothetical protein
MKGDFGRTTLSIALALITFVMVLGASSCNKYADDFTGLKTEDGPEIVTELTFKHTVPGQYSTVYLNARAIEGDVFTATLSGPSVDTPATKTLTVKASDITGGRITISWTIRKYGTYSVKGTVKHNAEYNFANEVVVK